MKKDDIKEGKRKKESITRDIFADQKREMEKRADEKRIPVAEQMRDALDAYLGLPKTKGAK